MVQLKVDEEVAKKKAELEAKLAEMEARDPVFYRRSPHATLTALHPHRPHPAPFRRASRRRTTR